MLDWIGEAMVQIDNPDSFLWVIEEIKTIPEGTLWKYKVPCGTRRVDRILYRNNIVEELTGDFLRDDRRGYTRQGPYLLFNFNADGAKVKLSTLAVDDDEIPLVPDHPSFRNALFNYIEKEYRYADLIAGRLDPRLYERIEQEWNWYCGQASNLDVIPNLDTIESIKNSWLRLKTRTVEGVLGFGALGNREQFDRR
jgi:hypothetical protein